MKFSIIVPVYNVEKYLPQCVESILAQTFNDFELVLVDDGSPDSCPKLCDDYQAKDKRIKVIHKENGGLSDARNAGIKVAVGDYLLFVDSDDYWNSTEVLSSIYKVLSNSHYDVLQFGMQKYYSNSGVLEPAAEQFDFYEKPQTKDYLNKAVAEKRLAISACSTVVLREFLLQNNLFFVKGIKSEDIEWGIRLFSQKPKVFFMKDVFYVYRIAREGSITSTVGFKNLVDYYHILEDSVALIEQKNDESLNALMSYAMYQLTIACALSRKVKLKKAERKEINSHLKKIAKGRITKYTLDSRVKLASKVYKITGYSGMTAVLGFYLKHRGR